MKLLKLKGLLVAGFLLFGCNPSLPENYHMDKKYWGVSEYKDAIRQARYITPKEEGYPRFSDPLTAPVLLKLVDKENVSVVLEDEQLGLQHRKEVAQDFFNVSGDIVEIYKETDIQDKFIYPMELISAIDFTLHTQLLYFKIGNDAIIKDAVNPESSDVKRVLHYNRQAVVDNFKIYIEFLTREDALSEDARLKYAEIIRVQYPRLIEKFPGANYTGIKKSATLVSEKVKTPEIKKALAEVVEKIDNLG